MAALFVDWSRPMIYRRERSSKIKALTAEDAEDAEEKQDEEKQNWN